MQRYRGAHSTECSICKDDFRDPRYLPCGHAFCTPCLQELIDKIGINDDGPVYIWLRMFRCPNCRNIVEAPEKGAKGFPRDVPLVDELDNRRIEQNRTIATVFGYVILTVVIAFLLNWRFQYELDVERESCLTDKRKHTVSEMHLKRQVEDLTAKRKQDFLEIKRLEKYIDELQYPYDPALTKTFELEPAESRTAVALTLIDGKLLIANSINGDLKLRDAYSVTKETDWATIPTSTVAGMGLCRKNGQVFVSTWNKYIFRFNRNGQLLDQWPVETVASGVISVTDDCNVVLAVRDNSKKILTYSTYGEIISEVEMEEEILESRLIKAVQISRGHFLVSYGEEDEPVHGIAIINANGQTIKSYGRWKGADVGQLNFPRDFVVDRLGNVLVADSGNRRILLLDSDLKFKRELVSTRNGLQNPFGILLNECETLLYVADNQWKPTKNKWTDGRILVFKMK